MALGRTLEELAMMPVAELLQWTAFEQVYGPILPHERIDLGLSRLSYYLVSLLSRGRRREFETFLPHYMQEMVRHRSSDPSTLQSFFQGLADANDQHAHS